MSATDRPAAPVDGPVSVSPARASPGAPGARGGDHYVLGVNEAEIARLGFQHQLWSEAAHACWDRAAVRPGQTVLDIGAGPGFATFDLAQIVGETGRVIALDEADRYLHHVREQAASRGLAWIETLKGDASALSAAGVKPGSVDVAYSRWCFCFLRDSASAVREAARALKPGGRLCIQDYFHYESMTIAPKSEVFSAVIRAVGQSWRTRGGNPDVMGSLPGAFLDNGLEVESLRNLTRIARPGSMMWEWPTAFWRNFVPELERLGLVSAELRRAFEAEWVARTADPRSWIYLPPMFELIGVKR